jgi:3,4-dehydroadipyl-CoA semialdehyde dehydrogenase
MQTLRSYLEGKWVEGKDPSATLVDPSTEEALAKTSSAGLDFGAAVEFARKQGGPALRELSFAQRGALLKAWSKALYEKRDELIQLAMRNGGNTRGDAKFDVDGAIGTLAHYAELGAGLGDLKALRDGEAVQLGPHRALCRHPLVGAARRRHRAHQRLQLPRLGHR